MWEQCAPTQTTSRSCSAARASATDGERELVAEARPDLLELATELVGDDPFARADEATRFAQPAIYCAQIARFERLGRPAACLHAGHSLGELAALATAGAVDDRDGLRLAAVRGRLMDEAATAAPRAACSRSAVIARRPWRWSSTAGLSLANENSPAAVRPQRADRSASIARANRRAPTGLRAKRLTVAGAFHSPLMEPAVAEFSEALAAIEFRQP